MPTVRITAAFVHISKVLSSNALKIKTFTGQSADALKKAFKSKSAVSKFINDKPGFDNKTYKVSRQTASTYINDEQVPKVVRKQAKGFFDLAAFKKVKSASNRPPLAPQILEYDLAVQAPVAAPAPAIHPLPQTSQTPAAQVSFETIENTLNQTFEDLSLESAQGAPHEKEIQFAKLRQDITKALQNLNKAIAGQGGEARAGQAAQKLALYQLFIRASFLIPSQQQSGPITAAESNDVSLRHQTIETTEKQLETTARRLIALHDQLNTLAKQAEPDASPLQLQHLLAALGAQTELRAALASGEWFRTNSGLEQLQINMAGLERSIAKDNDGAQLSSLLAQNIEFDKFLRPLITSVQTNFHLENFARSLNPSKTTTELVQDTSYREEIARIRNEVKEFVKKDIALAQAQDRFQRSLKASPDYRAYFGRRVAINPAIVQSLRAQFGDKSEKFAVALAGYLLHQKERERAAEPLIQSARDALNVLKKRQDPADHDHIHSLEAFLALNQSQHDVIREDIASRIEVLQEYIFKELSQFIALEHNHALTRAHNPQAPGLRYWEPAAIPRKIELMLSNINQEIERFKALNTGEPGALQNVELQDCLERYERLREGLATFTQYAQDHPNDSGQWLSTNIGHLRAQFFGLEYAFQTLPYEIRRLHNDATPTSEAYFGGITQQEIAKLNLTAAEQENVLSTLTQLSKQGVAGVEQAKEIVSKANASSMYMASAHHQLSGFDALVKDHAEVGSTSERIAGQFKLACLQDVLGRHETNPANILAQLKDPQSLARQRIRKLNADGVDTDRDTPLQRAKESWQEQQGKLLERVADISTINVKHNQALDAIRKYGSLTSPATGGYLSITDKKIGLEKVLKNGIQGAAALVTLKDLLQIRDSIILNDQVQTHATLLNGVHLEMQKHIEVLNQTYLYDFSHINFLNRSDRQQNSIQDVGRLIYGPSYVDRLAPRRNTAPQQPNLQVDFQSSTSTALFDAAQAIVFLHTEEPALRVNQENAVTESLNHIEQSLATRREELDFDSNGELLNSGALERLINAAVIEQFQVVKQDPKKQFLRLEEFEPSEYQAQINAILQEWGLKTQYFEPEINHVLSHTFGPNEMDLWIQSWHPTKEVLTAKAAEKAAQTARIKAEKSGFKKGLSSTTIAEIVKSVDRLEPSKTIRWAVGEQADGSSGNWTADPLNLSKFGGRLGVNFFANLQIERDANSYMLTVRSGGGVKIGVDAGVSTPLSIPGTQTTLGPSTTVSLEDNFSRGPGFVVRFSPTAGGPDSGKEKLKEFIEQYFTQKITAESFSQAEYLFPAVEYINAVKGTFKLSAQAKADGLFVLEAGQRETAQFAMKHLSGSNTAIEFVKKEKAYTVGTEAFGLGSFNLAGLDTAISSDPDVKNTSATGVVGAAIGIDLTIKQKQKYIFRQDGSVSECDYDYQFNVPPTGVDELTVYSLGGPQVFDFFNKEENQAFREQLRVLCSSARTDDIIKVRHSLRVESKSAVDALALEREALEKSQTGITRAQAKARIKEISKQIDHIISDLKSYEVKRVMLLQTKNSRTALGLNMLNVGLSTYSEGYSEWLCRDLRLG
jgi:hypothetical protein